MSKPQREELEKDKNDGLKAIESEEEVEMDEEREKINGMTDNQVFRNLLYMQYQKEKRKKETKPKKVKWFDESRAAKLLNEKVPAQFCTNRPGGGGTLTYLEGNVVMSFANAIFSPYGWSTSVKNRTVNVKQEGSKWSVVATADVRVTLSNGAYREDTGVGTSSQSKLLLARETAEKASITDGIKRALRQFGNLLGNSLYDSDYVRGLDINKKKDVLEEINTDVIEFYINKEKEERREKREREELERQKKNPLKREVPMKKEEKKEEKKEVEEKKEEDMDIDDILKLM